MNAVDGSEHYDHYSDEPPPSLLTIVLDTNPLAWARLADTLTLWRAVANLLVFINAHLAFNYANQVAVIASHCNRTRWLFPAPTTEVDQRRHDRARTGDGDVEMADVDDAARQLGANGTTSTRRQSSKDTPRGKHTNKPSNEANKYRPFRQVEDSVLTNLRALVDYTTADSDMTHTSPTMMAGALTLALAYINRQMTAFAESNGGTGTLDAAGEMLDPRDASASSNDIGTKGLQSRILVISVSNDVAFQYIPIMNCIFAAQRKHIPIDVLKLSSTTSTFLQQASDATKGIYMHLESPSGLLQYLMMAFLPDQTARRNLILPTQVDVDFRAACFCHKKVVDVGFVCSICLSIFCEPPPNAECLTCGTHLQLGHYGAKPALVSLNSNGRNASGTKKKRRKGGGGGGGGGGGTGSGVGTPSAGGGAAVVGSPEGS